MEKGNELTRKRVIYGLGEVARIELVLQMYYLNPFLLDVVQLRPSFVGQWSVCEGA